MPHETAKILEIAIGRRVARRDVQDLARGHLSNLVANDHERFGTEKSHRIYLLVKRLQNGDLSV